MALSAVNCIQRGIANLRGNWELVLVSWLQGLLTASLVLAGLAPPLGVVGLASFDWWEASEAEWIELAAQAGELVRRGPDSWMLLGASLLVSFAIWLAAFLVYCFFQGGIYGVLMTGDRQAPAGTPRGWQWFRTFSGRDVRGWGGRFLWRYFWLLNVFAAISLLWLLVVVLLFGLTVLGGEQWGMTAAFGIGCGSAIPMAFGLLVLVLWANIAQADLARQESGVGTALRRSFVLLGRRLGAVTLIFGIALALAILVGVGISLLSFFAGFAVPGTGLPHWLGALLQFGFSAVEMILGSVVAVGYSASLVGLVRSEAAQELPG